MVMSAIVTVKCAGIWNMVGVYIFKHCNASEVMESSGLFCLYNNTTSGVFILGGYS